MLVPIGTPITLEKVVVVNLLVAGCPSLPVLSLLFLRDVSPVNLPPNLSCSEPWNGPALPPRGELATPAARVEAWTLALFAARSRCGGLRPGASPRLLGGRRGVRAGP